MAPQRRYYKRRNGSQQFLSTAEKGLSMAGKALSIATAVASLVNVEFKRSNTSGSLSPSNTGIVTRLVNISDGSDAVQRVGNEVELKSLNFKALMQQSASSVTTKMRVLIVLDTENRGVAPAVTDILETTDVNDFINWDNRKRFKILKDQLYSFGDRTARVFEYYKNFGTRGLKLEWDGTNADNTNNNVLYLVTVSDEPTNVPGFQFKCRSVYIDN